MIAQKNKNDEIFYEGFFEKKPISYSFSDMSAAIPKVNFKKIKLTKFQTLFGEFQKKSVTHISFDEQSFNFGPLVKELKENKEKKSENLSVNPLRKKVDKDEIDIQRILNPSKEEKTIEVDDEKISKKDITFNIESQIVKHDENVILTPDIVPRAVPEEEIVSASDESNKFIWPLTPDNKKKTIKGKSKKQKKSKKPYFLTDKPVESFSAFPWASSEKSYDALETIFQGGLESELLDETQSEVVKPEEKEKQVVFVEKSKKEQPIQKDLNQNLEPVSVFNPEAKQLRLQDIVFKAFTPDLTTDFVSDIIKNNINPKDIKIKTVFDKSNTVDFGVGLLRKAEKMFEKYGGSKLSPVRIIIVGGVAATIGYLFWSYGLPNLEKLVQNKQDESNVVVRDLFNQTLIKKKKLALYKTDMNGEILPEENENAVKPISELARLALIEKAREALESRLDPFGQEYAPSSTLEDVPGATPTGKPSPDILLMRKQLELVGIISAENKNIALVNIYVADYSVKPDDDKATRETKLKAALGMAVPNRMEVSILDPLEDWYVKQIMKSRSRSEDPTIELVKGDKKFKLRVGQKVLLPEDKTFEQIKEELGSKSSSGDDSGATQDQDSNPQT